MVNLNPTVGHEQSGVRPCLVISDNKFNHGRADLVVVLPITSVNKGIPSHVKIPAGEANLSMDSFVKCEEVRCVSKDRFQRQLGRVANGTLAHVERNVRIILGL